MEPAGNFEEIFAKFDADKDGRLMANEIQSFMKEMGQTLYLGSINKVIRRLNLNQEINSLNLEQTRDFYQSFETPTKHELWSAKLQILEAIHEIQQVSVEAAKEKGNEGGGAAPGMATKVEQSGSQHGNLSVTVGPKNQNYNSNIIFDLEKKSKEEGKPFLKLQIQADSSEHAKKIEELIKKTWEEAKTLIIQSDPTVANEINSFHLMPSVNGNIVQLFITTSHALLLEIFTLIGEFLDRALGTSLKAKVHTEHHFNYDCGEFMENENYSFYDIFTKNMKLKVQWDAFDIRNLLKKLMEDSKAFSDFSYDATQPDLLGLIGLLHTEEVNMDLQFDNHEQEAVQTETKGMIIAMLGEIKEVLNGFKDENNLNIFDLLEVLNGKINLEVVLGEWKLQTEFKVKNITSLLLKESALPPGEFDSD